jgi:hypothetical protein
MDNNPRIIEIRPAGDQHQVISVHGGTGLYRRRPCGAEVSTPERPGCPWRADAVGHFPPEAFAHSAHTAEDCASRTFACHEAGVDRSAICAGFLLQGADHNLSVRVRRASGKIDMAQVTDGGYELHAGYTTMAVANGLDEGHPALRNVRLSRDETIQRR